LSKEKYLLDVNVLIALAEPKHIHHVTAMKWFGAPSLGWGLCAFSEAGFLRVAMNPKLGSYSLEEATNVLAGLINRPGYRYWPITAGWAELVAPFQERVWGHQQVTDAWLLGLAIKERGILVTLDKAIRYMAGPKYSKHVLVLE
jgi:toxin-antitoxin system PIN domain toxin